MIGDGGDGPERPEFAGIQGERRRCAGRCSRSQFDSLNGDEEVDDVELQDASAWRRAHCNGGASSTTAAMVCGFVSRS
jgi:hypothetical protein